MSNDSAMMIICPNCDYENPDGSIICYHCGLLLNTGETNLLDNNPPDPSRNREWGTASLGQDRVLRMVVRGYEDMPMDVYVDSDMVLGRSHESHIPDIDLTDWGAMDRGVSRQHALLRRQGRNIMLMDLNSANGTFQNGARLLPDQPRLLRDGDEIRLGQMVLRVRFV